MAKPEHVISLRINYKDIFSVKGLYKVVRYWLCEEGYCKMDDTDKWIETLYVERVGAAGDKEMWFWWRTQKDVEYFKFLLNIDFHLLGLTSTEIMFEGKKIKTNQGELDMEFFAFVQFDPAGKWDKHFFLSQPLVANWWKKRVYKKEADKKKEMLYKDAYRLQNAVKQYLELKSFLDEYGGKPFHPAKFPTA